MKTNMKVDWERFAKNWFGAVTALGCLIEHPHFQYILIGKDGFVRIKMKPFWRWLDGNRVIDASNMPGEFKRMMGVNWRDVA